MQPNSKKAQCLGALAEAWRYFASLYGGRDLIIFTSPEHGLAGCHRNAARL